MHRLVCSDHLGAETPAQTVATIVGWIKFACRSTDPETDGETEAKFESFPSFGSPSARLEGAEALLDLCLKRPEIYPASQPLIDRMLIDPHPAVRMNAADHLVRIWDLDRQGFWERATRIVAEEQNRGVLDLFATQTLGRLVWHGTAREVADLVLPLLDRLPASEKRNAGIREHLVQMALQFWLRFDFSDAAERVKDWAPLRSTTSTTSATPYSGFATTTRPACAKSATTIRRSIAIGRSRCLRPRSSKPRRT